MAATAGYTTIGLKAEQVASLRTIKAEWERLACRRFRWGDFLMMLVGLPSSVAPTPFLDEVPVVQMGQDAVPASDQPGDLSLEYDEALSLETAHIVGSSAVLTSSPSEKHGWRVFGGMMGPVQ